MGETIRQEKCINCAAPLPVNVGTGNCRCDYCGSEFLVAAPFALPLFQVQGELIDWESYVQDHVIPALAESEYNISTTRD